MGARPAHFRQADIKRTLDGIDASKWRNARVEISPDGTISIILGDAAKAPARRNTMDDLVPK